MTSGMARRREERLTLVLNVRVWGMDSDGKPFSQNAQTVDITRMGARVGPITCLKKPGEVIAMQYGEEKARYRVIWVGRMGTPTGGMVGLHCVEPEKFIFKSAWPKGRAIPQGAQTAPPVPGAAIGRRLHQRHVCSGGAQVVREGTRAARWATVRDISLTGVYLETTEPIEPQSRVEVTVTIEGIEFTSHAVVRTSKASVGMGLAFTEMTVDNRDKLDQLIHLIEEKLKGPPPEKSREDAPSASQPGQPVTLLNAPVVLPRAAELAIRIQNTNNELRELETLLAHDKAHMDPRVIRDFHNAIVHLRQVTWGVQRWLQLKTQDRDPFDVLSQMHGERMRFSTELSKELAMDLEAMELDLTSGDIPNFYMETKKLYRALAKSLGKDEELRKGVHEDTKGAGM